MAPGPANGSSPAAISSSDSLDDQICDISNNSHRGESGAAQQQSGGAAQQQSGGAAQQPPAAAGDGAMPGSWSISFEQFLASILTESVLVEYFSQPIDIKVKRYRT